MAAYHGIESISKRLDALNRQVFGNQIHEDALQLGHVRKGLEPLQNQAGLQGIGRCCSFEPDMLQSFPGLQPFLRIPFKKPAQSLSAFESCTQPIKGLCLCLLGTSLT